MSIFKIQKDKLIPIKERLVDLEKDIQKLTENNLKEIFNLVLVSSEFTLHNFRIDTLVFDPEIKSFVIIEYKKDRSFSVIDQGYTYLSLMLNNKSDFILEYNEKTHSNLKRNDIDWSQSRVMFLANSFTLYQRNAINFKDLPIELWEVKVFDNDAVLYNQLVAHETKESIKTVSKAKSLSVVEREIKTYSIEHHLEGKPEKTKSLFYYLREKILTLSPDVKEVIRKQYIGYKVRRNFAEVHLDQNAIRIWLDIEKGRLQDPRNLSRDMVDIGHWGTGDVEIKLNKTEDTDDVFNLITQSFETIEDRF